jgi:hypothetical protein
MATNLIIVTDNAARVDRDKITLRLSETGVAWWHRFRQLWLIVDSQERTAAWWRGWVRDTAPGVRHLVMSSKGGDWAGYLVPEQGDWLHRVWSRKKL